MPRKIVIVGNGIGMAIDPHHFSLDAALREIWNRDEVLTGEQKILIERCLGRAGAPRGENELNELHRAITYCKALSEIGAGDVHWLTDDGQAFPQITATYVHKVATRLHNYDGNLPAPFEAALIDFVRRTRSHIATLNYDKLLYSSFIRNGIFGPFDTTFLVDGMIASGFSSRWLERRGGRQFGYYLHLHGSPLFVNRGEVVIKLPRDSLTLELNEASEHIVLTHVRNKPAVIAASQVLSIYWEYLRFALSEVDEIILFGYSGMDIHLNALLRPYLATTPVRIVEWAGAGGQRQRDTYWRTQLGTQAEVLLLENITEFTEW